MRKPVSHYLDHPGMKNIKEPVAFSRHKKSKGADFAFAFHHFKTIRCF